MPNTLGECQCCGFDPKVRVNVGTTFWGTLTTGLKAHEQGHQQDYQAWWQEQVVNAFIRTEGFATKQDCERARSKFIANANAYDTWIEAMSLARDTYLATPAPLVPRPALDQ